MTKVMHGTISGTTIVLSGDPGLANGQPVEVTVRAINSANIHRPGDGIRAAFGGWSDDPEGLDEYLRQVREDRKRGRRPLE
jgi:hypothetical protein